MILQVPTKIKIDGVVLELEYLNRELGDTFGDQGQITAQFVGKTKNGLKAEFNVDYFDSQEFEKLLKQAKGVIIYE